MAEVHDAAAYRPDIDGLRAVAVLSVVAYHLNPSFVPGGYVGVDIFFVISGYLITRNIWLDLQANRFSIRGFYLRRIRRIAPAFLVMTAITLVVGCLVMLPDDLRRLGASAGSAAAAIPNLYFWRYLDTSYFAASSDQEPLLHTWTLGVEEQFYLLWPAILLGIALLPRSRAVAIATAGAILVGSFALGQALLDDAPKFAYFMLPARAGELMMGAFLVLLARPRAALDPAPGVEAAPGAKPAGRAAKPGELPGQEARDAARRVRRRPNLVGDGLAVLGLAAIVYALTQLDATSPFPGINALYPCVGAALVIVAGARGSAILDVLLANRLMVAIGLISYSLYLWHWPVLAFLRYLSVPFGLVEMVLAVAAMTVLAVASYRFVETPARNWRTRPRIQVAALLVGPAGAVAVAALVVYATGGLQPLVLAAPGVQAAVEAAASETRKASDYDYNCQQARYQAGILQKEICLVGARGGRNTGTLLWGDSHAAAFVGLLGAIAEDAGVRVRNASFSACPPVFGGEWSFPPYKAGCNRFRALMEDEVAKHTFRTMVIAGEWTAYDRNPAFRRALRDTVRTIAASGTRVVLLGQVPLFEGYDGACAARSARVQLVDCSTSASRPDEGELDVNHFIASLADTIEGVTYRSVRNLICDGSRCSPYVAGHPVYFDTAHLSMEGSWRLGRMLVSTGAAREWRVAVGL